MLHQNSKKIAAVPISRQIGRSLVKFPNIDSKPKKSYNDHKKLRIGQLPTQDLPLGGSAEQGKGQIMKSTGIIRNVDGLGRIVLPKDLRKQFGVTPQTPLEILTDTDCIILRKYRPLGCCDFCGEVAEAMVEYRGKHICGACRRALAAL